MVFLRERIGKLIQYLQKQIYTASVDVEHMKMIKTGERFRDIAGLNTSSWEDLTEGELWGGHREYYWFETTVTIPEEFDGRCAVFELLTGREGSWDATNPQFSCYVNGVLRQGFDVNHHEIILDERAAAGTQYRIVLSAFTGDQNFNLKFQASLKVLDRRTEEYYYDLSVPYETACLLQEEDQAYITIITSLNESLNLLDFRREGSEEYYESMERAREYLQREFYEKYCGETKTPVVYCVGHTHIDCAWMWTLKVTEDKAVRSFSTVLELMRRYPEYRFMSSQPQLYKYVKKNAPEIYEQIKERVREGRWEPEGGMFVEADCNLASGEALIRQLLCGQRFFQEEFGVKNRILWLPDVFGYSAALPQIMKKCGLKYFMTTKINWSEFNKMPCDTFWWEGIDGTRVLTHFIPARDYNKETGGSNKSKYFTTYNGLINPSQVKGSWARYSQKYLNQEVLMAFGYGDGGGGPTVDMLENQRRLSRGIPGCPRTRMSSAGEFFETLEEHTRDRKYMPSWVGELYLEYHRGTYTSMGRNKRYNRKSEFALENAESFGVLSSLLAEAEYPKEILDGSWEAVLRNQFHDILPGSSIKEVYDDSKEEYEAVLEAGRQMISRELSAVTERIEAEKGAVVVFNPNGMRGDDVAAVEAKELEFGAGFVLVDGERELPVQRTADGQYLFYAPEVPSKGYKAFSVRNGVEPVRGTMEVSAARMENRFFIIEYNDKGQFSRIYDKRERREFLSPGTAGNVIMSYEDRPHNYDAWDINNYYVEKSWEIDQVTSMKVTEDGPVRAAVTVVRDYLDSRITQTIYIYEDIPRIDIKNVVDWREHLILLKDLFPLDIHTDEAAFEIQFGNVTRPTHSNTSWDLAKFEVCAHKWIDVSEYGYGVSLLNDSKYGCSVKDGVVGLTMLKSPIYPNPDADKEVHEFWYSIYPHRGEWRQGETVKQAYQLNNPMQAVRKQNKGGSLPGRYSLITVDAENVVIEAIKLAEDGDGIVARLYECHNRRTEAVLTTGHQIRWAAETDMLEENPVEMAAEGNRIGIRLLPYEIKTVKIKFE